MVAELVEEGLVLDILTGENDVLSCCLVLLRLGNDILALEFFHLADAFFIFLGFGG